MSRKIKSWSPKYQLYTVRKPLSLRSRTLSWKPRSTTYQDSTQTENFIECMQRHVMSLPTITSTWLQKEDCNIFLLGETHSTSKGVYEMFVSLLKDLPTRNVPRIDLMLEVTQESDLNFYTNRHLRSAALHFDILSKESGELNKVRHLLSQCSRTRDCELNVHWMDPNTMFKVFHLDKPCGAKGVKGADRLPRWIYELSKIPISKTAEFNHRIQDKLQSPDDLIKLLTEHCVVKKEIERASKVHPQFTMDFAIPLFLEFINKYSKYKLVWRAQLSLRAAIDFYTAARIIKSRMKNVMVYGGNSHTSNIITILSRLGFQVKH
jgi:hypothetical protein